MELRGGWGREERSLLIGEDEGLYAKKQREVLIVPYIYRNVFLIYVLNEYESILK